MFYVILPSPQEVPALVPARGSVTWRVAGDVRLLAGAAYALLLQVSHPTVGAGVTEHSRFAEDPWGRLFRTLDYLNGTVYGGPVLAGEIGRRVRAVHHHIKGVRPDGVRYHSLEPEAYAWVHATLAKSIVKGHRVLGTPMSVRETETFWEEWRRAGRLVGVRERDLPETWRGFVSYCREMVADRLERTAAVDEVLETIAGPAVPPPHVPAAVWPVLRFPAARQARLTTAGLLGPVLRERFGIEWKGAHARAYAAAAAASRASGPLMRGPLAEFGPYYLRWRREALARGEVAAAA